MTKKQHEEKKTDRKLEKWWKNINENKRNNFIEHFHDISRVCRENREKLLKLIEIYKEKYKEKEKRKKKKKNLK